MIAWFLNILNLSVQVKVIVLYVAYVYRDVSSVILRLMLSLLRSSGGPPPSSSLVRLLQRPQGNGNSERPQPLLTRDFRRSPSEHATAFPKGRSWDSEF